MMHPQPFTITVLQYINIFISKRNLFFCRLYNIDTSSTGPHNSNISINIHFLLIIGIGYMGDLIMEYLIPITYCLPAYNRRSICNKVCPVLPKAAVRITPRNQPSSISLGFNYYRPYFGNNIRMFFYLKWKGI